jgi:hypothetical protein
MTTPFEALTADYRLRLAEITNESTRSMMALWQILDPRDLNGTFDAWAQAVKILVRGNRELSTRAAEDYLAKIRAEFGLDQFPAQNPVGIPDATVENRLRSVVVNIKEASGRGVDPLAAASGAFVNASGLVQEMVLHASRSSVSRTAVRDPSMGGWRRIGRGSCAFCSMLISRGAVYNSLSVRFASHKHCRCSAEPAIRGVASSVNSVFVPSARNISDADRARVRAYLADNDAG